MQFPRDLRTSPVVAGGYPYGQLLSASPDKPVFSKIDSFEPYLEEMEQFGFSPKSPSWLPVSPGLIFQRQYLAILFFSGSGSHRSC